MSQAIGEPRQITVSEGTYERLERLRAVSDYTLTMDDIIQALIHYRGV